MFNLRSFSRCFCSILSWSNGIITTHGTHGTLPVGLRGSCLSDHVVWSRYRLGVTTIQRCGLLSCVFFNHLVGKSNLFLISVQKMACIRFRQKILKKYSETTTSESSRSSVFVWINKNLTFPNSWTPTPPHPYIFIYLPITYPIFKPVTILVVRNFTPKNWNKNSNLYSLQVF